MDGIGNHNLNLALPPTPGPTPTITFDFDSKDYEPTPDFLGLLWRTILDLLVLAAMALERIRSLRQEVVELRRQAHYWQAQHQRAREREDQCQQKIQHLEAQIRDWERRVYGRKTETSGAVQPPSSPSPTLAGKPRPRGQQRGSKGHGRRRHEHLPATSEILDLPPDQKCCRQCGQAFEAIPGAAEGEVLEIEVRAYRRRYHRQRYRRRCTCPAQPVLITAPPPDKLIPKSHIGISLWVMILRKKFEFFQPLYRILAELRGHDLRLSGGTITDGLQKLVPLFQPLYDELVEHNRGEKHWHCDETRWLVFVKRDDKVGFCWNLWVFAAKESIVFVLDPTRSHNVPEDHFGDDARGIASVDRYSSYKAMAQAKSGRIVLAFCWAHVRRDFLTVLTSWPELLDWAWSWVEAIGELYQRNDQRLALRDKPEYAEADRQVRDHLEQMRQRRDRELSEPKPREPQRKVLQSLVNHWQGLTVFVDHPDVPLDNNEAERRERGPVVGRKNFYGSGSLWSGRLAAMLFSLFQTIQSWKMDVGCWLNAYLSACAHAGGQPPPTPRKYLPWNLSEKERQRLSVASSQPPARAPESQPTAAEAGIVG